MARDEADAHRINLIKERRFSEAIDVQMERLARKPTDAELHHQMAWLMAAVHDLAAAAAHETVAAALDPENSTYRGSASAYCQHVGDDLCADTLKLRGEPLHRQRHEVPKNSKPTGMVMDPYSTHQALLLAGMALTEGAIIELGGGWYSTPLVNAMSHAFQRFAITVETGAYVHNLLKRLETQHHRILLMPGFEFDHVGKFRGTSGMSNEAYKRLQQDFLAKIIARDDLKKSVVLVDQAPGFLRGPAIELFAEKADFIVVHDTEHTAHYHYEPLLSSFRSRWDFTLHRPNSTVVSNFNDCSVFSYLAGDVDATLNSENSSQDAKRPHELVANR